MNSWVRLACYGVHSVSLTCNADIARREPLLGGINHDAFVNGHLNYIRNWRVMRDGNRL